MNTLIVPVLTGSIAVIGANSLALSPIAPAISADFAVGVTTTLFASGGYGIGTALGALFLSRHIDAVGVRLCLCWSLAALAGAFLVCALSPGIAVFIASQFVSGLAAGVGLPAIYAFAAFAAPKGQESAVLGRVLVGWTISMIAGVSLSAVIADFLHWRGVYCALAAGAVAALFFVARIGNERREIPNGTTNSALSALAIEGVPALILICLAYMTAFYGTYAYIGDHIHSHLGLPVTAGGMVALTYGLGFGAATFGDPTIDRFGVRRVMPACFLSISLIYVLLGLAAGSYAMLLAVSFAWGVVNHFGLNLIVAGLCAIDARQRGAILGLNSAATYLAASVGVLTFGPLYESQGFGALAIAASIAAMAAAGLALSALQKDPPKAE